MKKFVLLFAAAMMLGSAVPAVAQQKKTVKKTVAKKAPAKKTVAKKAVAVAPLDINEGEFLADGHAAVMGIAVKQPQGKIEAALKEKGFVNKTVGYEMKAWVGTLYGVTVNLSVDAPDGISYRERKDWTRQQAFNRVVSYQKQITAVTGALPEGQLGMPSEEGGMVTLRSGKCVYTIQYQNQDEVDFSSKYFDIVVSVREE